MRVRAPAPSTSFGNASSELLAARSNGLSDGNGRAAAAACARSYRRKMRDFASMDVLDVWYARLDDTDVLAMLPQDRKAALKKRIAKATAASIRSWCSQNWSRALARGPASTTLFQLFFMPKRLAPPATWR